MADKVGTLSVAGRHFNECAIFPNLGAVSVSFAFDVSPARGHASPDNWTAFRLVALSRHLDPDEAAQAPGNDGHRARLHNALIEPVRSFLDDVTNGDPGVNGRPLLVLASGAAEDAPSREVALVRPPCWEYEAEGEVTRLDVPEALREIPLMLRDSFCVFESGQVYYVVTLVQCPDCTGLDEYALLQIEQLLLQPKCAENPGYLGFRMGGEALSLADFANARLRQLRTRAVPGTTPGSDDALNAVADLLIPFDLVRESELPETLTADHLVSLCMGVEDEPMQQAAAYVRERLDPQATTTPERPASLDRLESDWTQAAAACGLTDDRCHRQSGNDIDRALLALAGLATGVCDFPYQDESEVHDSTRPATHSVESALFTHPRFMLEVGASWRSFREGQSALGTCPYLFLTWMVAVHDQQVVSDMEQMLENLIYDPTGKLAGESERTSFRAEPLADVMDLLDSASRAFGQKTGVHERNLRERLEIFRWKSIHRCGNMFRYPKEKAALDAVRDKMGINDRFDEVHEALDRLENLVEDVSTLASAYSERRTNRLLGALALLALIAIPKDLFEGSQIWQSIYAWDLLPGPWLFPTSGLIVIALLALYFVKRGGETSGRRNRGKSAFRIRRRERP